MKSKYSKRFDDNFNWYLKVRTLFNFDGNNSYHNLKGNALVVYDNQGVSGKEAFYQFDTYSKIVPTKHPNILLSLLKTKGSVNLHIKMYAEDRANGTLPLIMFSVRETIKKHGKFDVLRPLLKCDGKEKTREYIRADLEHKLLLPKWFITAVENQKFKYYIC